jgi:VanZ family protein
MMTLPPAMPARLIIWIWRIALGALMVYWMVLFAGTHIHVPPEKTFQLNDKVLHFNGYWTLGFLLAVVMMLRQGPTRRRMAAVLAIVAGYGAVDEWTQLLVDRDCDFHDWLADLSGGAGGMLLGVGAIALLGRWLTKPALGRDGSAH